LEENPSGGRDVSSVGFGRHRHLQPLAAKSRKMLRLMP
jgi:hypothetical protein